MVGLGLGGEYGACYTRESEPWQAPSHMKQYVL